MQKVGFSSDSSWHEGDAVLLKERRQPWDVRLLSYTSCATESRRLRGLLQEAVRIDDKLLRSAAIEILVALGSLIQRKRIDI